MCESKQNGFYVEWNGSICPMFAYIDNLDMCIVYLSCVSQTHMYDGWNGVVF